MKLERHKSWDIIDAYKLKEYRTCKRRYFYRYILGWVPDFVNLDLVFGEAWHKAMEIVMLRGREGIEEAYAAFLSHYRQYYSDIADMTNAPKSPQYVLSALEQFCDISDSYLDPMLKWSTVDVEVGGMVPLGNSGINLTFRLDAVQYNAVREKYRVVEHKTTGMLSENWISGWRLSTQLMLYTYACRLIYGETDKIIVNGAIFRKSGSEIITVPVEVTSNMMRSFISATEITVNDIKLNESLLDSKHENGSMIAFPGSTDPSFCRSYFKQCPYTDFCVSYANPLERIDKVPEGFKVEYWNPGGNDGNTDT